jgi:hypothetical protein
MARPSSGGRRPRPARHSTVVLLCVALLLLGANVRAALQPRAIQTRSGQFTVRGLPADLPVAGTPALTNLSFIRLDPAVLAVSCERIKQAVLDVLGMPDQWQGRIFISLHPVRADREPILVRCAGFRDGWVYSIDLPEQVDRARLLKLVVEVLLLEIANRRARDTAAELPPWLAEGLAAHLQATALPILTLELETLTTREDRRPDPLRGPREVLRRQPALSFDELNWPAEDMASEERLAVYRSCAHLFVLGLLRLKNGRACLQDMLARLPEGLNWQTAFLRSFHQHFPRLVDADKWWTLNVVSFTGRDLFSTWSREESWRQLQAILHPLAQVRRQTNDLPRPTRVRLQTVVGEWDFARQSVVLAQVLNRLQALTPRADKELAEVVAAYARTLADYLAARDRPQGPERLRHPLAPNPALVASRTVRALDELDAQRERLRPAGSGRAEAVEGAIAETFR